MRHRAALLVDDLAREGAARVQQFDAQLESSAHVATRPLQRSGSVLRLAGADELVVVDGRDAEATAGVQRYS